MSYEDDTGENIARTLAEVLPEAKLLRQLDAGSDSVHVHLVALPKGYELKESRIDLTQFRDGPLRAVGVADFSQLDSFVDYVKRHASDATTVWCAFNPQSCALAFEAVLDEHAKGEPAWRGHRARFTPDTSAEWKAWKGQDRKPLEQIAFAEWIEEHLDDIAARDGFPTALQMLAMATDFVVNEDRVLKSSVRLQSGGFRLTYIADPDKATTETMQMFDRFALGIPVFQGGQAWAMTARLKYRNNAGRVSFSFELVRPDRVHDAAAREVIEAMRAALDSVPLLLGKL